MFLKKKDLHIKKETLIDEIKKEIPKKELKELNLNKKLKVVMLGTIQNYNGIMPIRIVINFFYNH